MDDDEIIHVMRDQFTDAKHNALLEATGEAVGEAMSGGGGEGDFEGDLDGDLEGDSLEGDDLGGEEEGEEGPLLAEPGQRDDYTPVASDQRRSGARKRSALASAGEKAAYPGSQRLFKGVADGLGPLSRGIVSAGVEREENLIAETNLDIKRLITELEIKHEDKA